MDNIRNQKSENLYSNTNAVFDYKQKGNNGVMNRGVEKKTGWDWVAIVTDSNGIKKRINVNDG